MLMLMLHFMSRDYFSILPIRKHKPKPKVEKKIIKNKRREEKKIQSASLRRKPQPRFLRIKHHILIL